MTTDSQIDAALAVFKARMPDVSPSREIVREMIEAADKAAWARPSKGLPPKPGKATYEQVPCLIHHNGEVKISMWNCEHFCWDDEYGDDFIATIDEVKEWRFLPSPLSKSHE